MRRTQQVNDLKKLKKHSYIVGDTSNQNAITRFKLNESTTNPTIILERSKIINDITIKKKLMQEVQKKPDKAADIFNVLIGASIAKTITGRISTEINPKHSFDIDKSIASANEIIKMYAEAGIPKEKVYIKIAGTWEGILAAEQLEKQGIKCNVTLIFNLCQAKACAERNISLISPFVGRILDWHKKYNAENLDKMKIDPGVQSVTTIYNQLKSQGYKTEVMAASFRNKNQILQLAGCDKMTINEKLLEELESSDSDIEVKLQKPETTIEPTSIIDESEFRWQMKQDKMAFEKLNEGIEKFTNDYSKVKDAVIDLITNKEKNNG